MPRKKKIKPIRRKIDFDMNLPAMEARSPQRELAKSILKEALVAETIKSMGVEPGETSVVRNLVQGRDYPGFILSQDERGFIARPKLSEPATYKNGGVRKKARQIARRAVERQKAVAKNLKKTDRSAGRALMKRVREDKRRIKKNYIQTRKDIKEQLKRK